MIYYFNYYYFISYSGIFSLFYFQSIYCHIFDVNREGMVILGHRKTLRLKGWKVILDKNYLEEEEDSKEGKKKGEKEEVEESKGMRGSK